VESFDVTATTDPLYPGSSAVAVDQSGDLALFGGADGVAGVYSVSQQKLVYALKVGSLVTDTLWWESRAVVSTASGAVKVFENGDEVAQLGSHAGAATSIALHPSEAILASAGADKRFIFYDLATYKVVSQVYTEAEISCCAFHVDGLLFFTGSVDGKIRIFDVKTGANMAVLDTSGPVGSISFSENGTWFAVAGKGSSSVSVWDLRKQVPIKELDVGGPVDSIHWDYTGQFLATAGPGSVSVQQYTKSSKSWSEPVRKAVAAKDVAWGANASSLIALTPEGGLSVLGAA
jgi:pre-mRNA-processing factor 19